MTEVGLIVLFMFGVAFGLSFVLAQFPVPRFIWVILVLVTGSYIFHVTGSYIFHVRIEDQSRIEIIFYFILFFLFVTFAMTALHQDIKNDSKK